MKKSLIIIGSLLTSLYITSAISLDLGSGDKLDNTNWQNINNITSEINLNSSDLNISGKLVTDSKICSGNNCLGICDNGYTWSISTNSCVEIASTPETSGESCKTILESNPLAVSGIKWIDIDGEGGKDPFKVYCDMDNDGGGWTLIGVYEGATQNYYTTGTECFATNPDVGEKCYITEANYGQVDWTQVRFRVKNDEGGFRTVIGQAVNNSDKWIAVDNNLDYFAKSITSFVVNDDNGSVITCSAVANSSPKERGYRGLLDSGCSSPSSGRNGAYGFLIAAPSRSIYQASISPAMKGGTNWKVGIWIK